MYLIARKVGEKIFYGFGFGLGMGLSFKLLGPMQAPVRRGSGMRTVFI